VLGEVSKTTVAFELFSRLFFLPFHSTRLDQNGAQEPAETVSLAIVGYLHSCCFFRRRCSQHYTLYNSRGILFDRLMNQEGAK
jgi:hypothetical protein